MTKNFPWTLRRHFDSLEATLAPLASSFGCDFAVEPYVVPEVPQGLADLIYLTLSACFVSSLKQESCLLAYRPSFGLEDSQSFARRRLFGCHSAID